jgi:hypothetical protein
VRAAGAAGRAGALLADLGLVVRQKPNGRALVLRTNVEEVLGGLPVKRKAKAPPAAAQPNAAGLVLAYSRARS